MEYRDSVEDGGEPDPGLTLAPIGDQKSDSLLILVGLAAVIGGASTLPDMTAAQTPVAYLAFIGLGLTALLVTLAYRRRKDRDGRIGQYERLLFAHARDGMLLVRVRGEREPYEFVIEAENPAARLRLNAFGQAKSYIGREIGAVFPEWLLKETRARYGQCVHARAMQRYEILQPDGTGAHESTATPVFDEARRKVTHIVVVMRDVSDRLKRQRALAAAVDQARAASKAKSEFLASMSHELRTPLNAVLGYSELLINGIGGSLPPKQVEYAQFIHQSGTHLLNIISDILDLSKIEAGALALQEQPTEIDRLIDTCMFMVRGRAQAKGLQIRVDIAPSLPVFQVDPLRLKQILINLLSNAIKFTEVGSVTLGVSFDPARGLHLTVSDTGIGMTEQEMRVALEYFGRSESAFSRNYEGTGLGLPIAQRLTDLHGGEMTIQSQTGIGTSVCVRLPASRAQQSRAAS